MEQRPLAKKLSKAVLELKFMKKSKEKAALQEENDERQQLYQDQLQSLHEGADQIMIINSYVDCIEFLPSRLSFGGMDPDVEKINEEKLTGLYRVVKSAEPKDVTSMDADVSVEEMAHHYKRKSNHLDDSDSWKDLEPNTDEAASTGKHLARPRGNSNIRPVFSVRGRRGDMMGRESGFRGKGRGEYRGRGNFSGRGRENFSGRGRANRNEHGEEEMQDFSGNGQPREFSENHGDDSAADRRSNKYGKGHKGKKIKSTPS